ncbi:MAG: hypothetical protein LBI53_08340 [Candidatus Peribacteria bacterium]|jgi:hypothetical protein|nr:hypothetical protein [Candidatus Peribacteria bacterium]
MNLTDLLINNRFSEKVELKIKKNLVLTLVLIFSLSLAACSDNNNNNSTGVNTSTSYPANNPDTIGGLTPPAWLIGSRTPEEGTFGEDVMVTADNVTVSSSNLNFGVQVNKGWIELDESLDGDVYTLAYTVANIEFAYIFEPKNGGMLMTINVDGAIANSMYKKK